jgi:GNAT superfamily N-acetyltransferase
VEPDQRGRGVAHGLLDLAVAEARRRGVEYMFLHATAMGRPIYERRGWRATSEMAILVKDA